MIQQIRALQSYADPVIQHPISQFAYRCVAECVKIFAAKKFLELLGQQFLSQSSKSLSKEIYRTIILAPLIEEILFRGILQSGSELLQNGWIFVTKKNLSDEDLKAQEIFRVRATTIIFGAAHLLNPHENISSAFIQFSWSSFGGLTYGYLKEKYHTLAVGILAHGLNNTIASAVRVYPEYGRFLFAAVWINKIGFYILATTSIDEKVKATIQPYYDSLKDRICRWIQPSSAPDTTIVSAA